MNQDYARYIMFCGSPYLVVLYTRCKTVDAFALRNSAVNSLENWCASPLVSSAGMQRASPTLVQRVPQLARGLRPSAFKFDSGQGLSIAYSQYIARCFTRVYTVLFCEDPSLRTRY